MLRSAILSGNTQLAAAEQNAPALGPGASGSGVGCLQSALIALGASMPISTRGGAAAPDGGFGPETRNAVIRFQQMNGLVADGIAGRMTLGRLDAVLVATKKDPVEAALGTLFDAVRQFARTTDPGVMSGLHGRIKPAIRTLSDTAGVGPGGPGKLIALLSKRL